MPVYSFENKKTKKQYDLVMTWDEKVQYLKDHPNVIAIITQAPGLADPVRLGLRKPSNNFRDRLKEIKKSHRHSTINII